MGISLKNIFSENEDELVVNRSKNAIRLLIVMAAAMILIIIIDIANQIHIIDTMIKNTQLRMSNSYQSLI